MKSKFGVARNEMSVASLQFETSSIYVQWMIQKWLSMKIHFLTNVSSSWASNRHLLLKRNQVLNGIVVVQRQEKENLINLD